MDTDMAENDWTKEREMNYKNHMKLKEEQNALEMEEYLLFDNYLNVLPSIETTVNETKKTAGNKS